MTCEYKRQCRNCANNADCQTRKDRREYMAKRYQANREKIKARALERYYAKRGAE